jgi:hypothetical protein
VELLCLLRGADTPPPQECEMRAAVFLAIIAAFVSDPAISYVVRHAAIPAPLQGTWAATDEDCKNADKSMIVSDKTYIDPEKNCSIFWVSETAAAHGSIYSAHMQCVSSAADPKNSIDNLLILAKDANHLAIGPELGKLKVVQRCAAP